MDKNNFVKLLNNINFDKDYIEATFQYKLLIQLAKIFDEDIIYPERNIVKYGLEPSKFSKKEIDIVIEVGENQNIAIELKMPMNGQVPEQMYKFIEDIKFLEELKKTEKFSQCFFIIVTKDKGFWEGKKTDGIYSYFRNNIKKLEGKIYKPTGNDKNVSSCELSGKYKIEWEELDNNFKYFMLEL